MDNLIPKKTKLTGIRGFGTSKKLENAEKTDERAYLHNRKFQTTIQSAVLR